jgi:hypothetical protein
VLVVDLILILALVVVVMGRRRRNERRRCPRDVILQLGVLHDSLMCCCHGRAACGPLSLEKGCVLERIFVLTVVLTNDVLVGPGPLQRRRRVRGHCERAEGRTACVRGSKGYIYEEVLVLVVLAMAMDMAPGHHNMPWRQDTKMPWPPDTYYRESRATYLH